MSKDLTASTRIPRLDGASRIPLPGTFRPPTNTNNTAQAVSDNIATRTTHIFQRASTVGFPQKRPTSLAGLRPSIANTNAIKRSASGDHITNAVSLVTKKTTTALKKWIGSKPAKMQTALAVVPKPKPIVGGQLQQNKAKRKQTPPQSSAIPPATRVASSTALSAGPLSTTNNYFDTPRPLTRSDTFVRVDSPNDTAHFSPSMLTQSTPAPSSNSGAMQLTTTRIIRPPDINETTKLLSNNTRHALYTTKSLDINQTNVAAPFGETFETSGTMITKDPEDLNYDQTINLNKRYKLTAAEAVLEPNLNTTFKAPSLFGQTMNVVSISDMHSADAMSPVTNATYSNPDSLDNLQLLEDVSAPSGFLELDITLQSSESASEHERTRDNILDCSVSSEPDEMNATLRETVPEKMHIKLPLNSTTKLHDITNATNMSSPLNERFNNKFNRYTKEFIETKRTLSGDNTSRLLYMKQTEYAMSERNTPDCGPSIIKLQNQTELLTSPQSLLKNARSDLVLPTRTPDDEQLDGAPALDEVDAQTLLFMGSRIKDFFTGRVTNDERRRQSVVGSQCTSLQDISDQNVKQVSRYSFGLDLTESTLDCSIELVDVSLSSNPTAHPTANSFMATHPHSPCTQSQSQSHQLLPLRRQTSFELDESLGILTPDQMKEFLDSTNTNNTNNLDLPLIHGGGVGNKISIHHMRIDQTPSPEELPLDPVEVKTDCTELFQLQLQQSHSNIFESTLSFEAQKIQQQQQHEKQLQQQQQQVANSNCNSTAEPISTNTDTDISSKASDAMTKSNVSKISTSFITSVTSVTSLDTGYQGDGEMSRPASRGACDHSPSNGPTTRKGGHVSRQPSFNQQLQQQQMPLVRRPDPMTDSDFFTESDADDIFHRGDRRAQVIDGQLYGPMLQPATSVFISEDPEDSCMESSGIFTDIENRCDDDLAQMRRQDTQDAMLDMSPDGGDGDGDNSTETVKSNRDCVKNKNSKKSEPILVTDTAHTQAVAMAQSIAATVATTLGQGQQLSNSQTSSTIHSSMSTDQLSAATLSNRTSYCSVDGNSTVNVDSKSFLSLEEAFIENISTHNSTGLPTNNITNTTTKNPTNNDERTKRSSHYTTTGNEQYSDIAGTLCNEQQQAKHVSVLRVTPPRKHASLNSLSMVNASNDVGFIGANLEKEENNVEIGTNVFKDASRDRVRIGRETRSESGTAGTKVACGGSLASTSSSTTSLSVDNQSNNCKNINVRYALEAAVAAAAVKTTKANAGGINNNTSTNNNNKSNNVHTSRTTKFLSARNSPKQRASSSNGSIASVSDIAGGGSGCGLTTLNVQRKKPTPNKWDAVMNKIQNNKLLPKKNFKEVKSKVSTLRLSNGLSVTSPSANGNAVSATTTNPNTNTNISTNGVVAPGRSNVSVSTARFSASSTPLMRRSPNSNCVSGTLSPRNGKNVSPATTTTTTAQQVSKRLFQGIAAKRGRSYSKDSQKSSQSDLSMASAGGGSPKLLAKTPLRAAKKRDVRNLSISPTDLGPPPKAQQTAKGTSTRLKPSAIFLTQKRYPSQNISGTPSTTSTAVSTPTGNGGGNLKFKSPPTVKKIIKDQNRGIGNVSTKNIKHTEAPTELHEIHHNNNNNNSVNTTTTTTTSNGTTATRTNSQTPSPILGHHGKKTATTTAASLAVGGTLLEKKSQAKLLPTRGKSLLQKSHQQQRSAEDAPVLNERLDAIELQRLKYLNRHSCNGRLDYEAIERHLEQTELQEAQRNKSIEVLGVLLQYAVHDLDAFACPRIKTEKNKIQTYLTTTLQLLDDAKITCTHLQDQLSDKEGYYSQREDDLQALHRCEIEKAHANLTDYQKFAQKKFTDYETQLKAKDVTHKRTLDSYRLELDNKLAQKQQQLDAADQRELELKQRLSALTISEQELNNKQSIAEKTYAQSIEAATERENQLNERLKVLTKELDSLRSAKANRERELRDKLNLSQDEISVLRSSQRSFNESLDRSSSGIGSPRNSSTSELSRLQSEADSLHCVLELKQKEISKLTKQNEELMRDAEERVVLQGKISLLESTNEMLKSELEIKSEKEKDFLRQMDEMQKAYNHEMVKRKRLSYDNEALQWQLKQRSEQLHIVESKLHEFSAHESINASTLSSLGGSLNRSQLLNGSSPVNIQMNDISPPTSPIVKGVIQKPDSVSWVLEMDDDTPEAAASKMVKRAGSFRSVERSPSTRRQLSACSSAINTSLNSVGNGNGNNSMGPNPLSQSMSATSVIRQHSSDVRHEFNNRSHSRIRSKSVCVKGSEATSTTSSAYNTGSIGTKSGKKLMRQNSSGSSSGTASARKQHQLELINWKEPMSSSSPHTSVIRARTSTMCSEVAGEQQQQQQHVGATTNNRKLITCDTSKLNSGERLDMQSLPIRTSVHDLKKKFHEIQESAGEAMVSGINSEDEGCSASSDEIVCSVSTSSATTGSTSSLKNSHMSLEEEVLLFDKINSLNGTPMEVSWSDDQEVFTNGSTV